MDISAHIRLMSTIRAGSMYRFAEETFKTSVPHYFVVLNINPKATNVAVLVCAVTLDIKTIETKERLGYARDTLIDITPEQCPLLTRVTLFDCNKLYVKTLPVLVDRLERTMLEVVGEVSAEVLDMLQDGALKSSHVERYLKGLIQ